MEWLISMGIVLLAGFIQSTTGFGFNLVATPLLLFFLEPTSVVPIVTLLGPAITLILLLRYWRHIDFKLVVLMSAGSTPGIFLGARLLTNLDPAIVKLIIAALIIPFSFLLLKGFTLHIKRVSVFYCVVGFLSGILVASTSLGGPPVVLFLLSQNLGKKQFIGTLNGYFLLTSIITTAIFVGMGQITADVLRQAGLSLPALVVGFYLGNRVVHLISPGLFKKIAAVVVMASAVSIIINTVTSL